MQVFLEWEPGSARTEGNRKLHERLNAAAWQHYARGAVKSLGEEKPNNNELHKLDRSSV